MPPIAQKKYCPIYTIELRITEKSFHERRSQNSIKRELAEKLGITLNHLYKIRKAQVGESSILSVNDLITIATYFDCSIDALIVKYPDSAYPPNPDTTSSPEEVAVGTNPSQS